MTKESSSPSPEDELSNVPVWYEDLPQQFKDPEYIERTKQQVIAEGNRRIQQRPINRLGRLVGRSLGRHYDV